MKVLFRSGYFIPVHERCPYGSFRCLAACLQDTRIGFLFFKFKRTNSQSMFKKLALSLLVCFPLVVVGCGGGGGENSTPAANDYDAYIAKHPEAAIHVEDPPE